MENNYLRYVMKIKTKMKTGGKVLYNICSLLRHSHGSFAWMDRLIKVKSQYHNLSLTDFFHPYFVASWSYYLIIFIHQTIKTLWSIRNEIKIFNMNNEYVCVVSFLTHENNFRF